MMTEVSGALNNRYADIRCGAVRTLDAKTRVPRVKHAQHVASPVLHRPTESRDVLTLVISRERGVPPAAACSMYRFKSSSKNSKTRYSFWSA